MLLLVYNIKLNTFTHGKSLCINALLNDDISIISGVNVNHILAKAEREIIKRGNL